MEWTENDKEDQSSFENVGDAQLLWHIRERHIKCLIMEDSVRYDISIKEYPDSSHQIPMGYSGRAKLADAVFVRKRGQILVERNQY